MPTPPTGLPAYPLARPDHGGDARFSFGLLLDITAALPAHGYPPVATGADLVRWQQALFTTIYQETP